MIAPDAAIERLRAGNRRYCSSPVEATARDHGPRRREVASGQQPFAVIVGCADSRVPPEIIFDQGLGDLFVIRIAGNLVTSAALGSVEFALGALGARLVVVLGHSRCGAVSAALAEAPPASRDLAALVAEIRSGLGRRTADPTAAVRANVEHQVERLRSHFGGSEPADLVIVGAEYDLDSGAVEFLADD